MNTLITKPVKAGVLMFMVLVLIASTSVPKVAVAAPSQSAFEYLPYPSIDNRLFPCISDIQEMEFVREQLQISSNTKLSYKVKVVYCNGFWEISANAGHEFGARYIEITGIGVGTAGSSVGVTNDGGISAGITIQESQVEAELRPTVNPIGFVEIAKFTRKADLSIQGLQIVSSIVRETQRNMDAPSLNYNYSYSMSPATMASLGILGAFVLYRGVQSAYSTSVAPFMIMTDEMWEDFMRRVDPSVLDYELQAYEGGYYPPSREIPTSLKNALVLRYPIAEFASLTELTAPAQVQAGDMFAFSGWGFVPNGKVLVILSMDPHDDTAVVELVANNVGEISGQITLPAGSQMRSGTYLLAAIEATSVYYSALKLAQNPNAEAKLYISGSLIEVVGGSATANQDYPSQTDSAPPLNCNKVSQFNTNMSYIFSGTFCGGELTWFSGHPSNGPSASGQSSLYVPTNAVVNVSSNDDNNGDKACFAETVYDLASVGWANRIQWAEVIPGGTCQSQSQNNDAYIVHTNQGDFTVTADQTWDNQQHNRQILGFDRVGTAHLIINHRGGASRCWNETKSASSLGDDGDWWLQTKSIQVGSGYCPGNDGELIVFVNNNFQSGEHSRVHAGTTHTYEDNNRKGSFRFSKPGMSAIFKAADGRTRCWNTDVTALGDHEDYGTRTVAITAYGTNVCPPPRAPEAPANLTASVNGSDQVTLNWTNDYGYNGGTIIWEKHPGQSAFVGNLSVGEGGTSFTYFVASCGQPVEYYVEAVDSDGRKAQSNHVFISTNSCSNLVAPTNFSATPIDYDSVRLDWDNNQSGVWDGYLVSYQKDDGSWVEIWPAGRYQNYFDINGLTPCYKPWTMAVAAYQNSTRSPKSLPVTFTLPGCPTAAPQNFTVSVQPAWANLSWTAHPYATSYLIEYSYNGAPFQPFQIGVTSSYNGWMGYPCGSTVTLRLSANTAYGRSQYSEVTFNGHVCASSLNNDTDQSMQIFLPVVSR